MVKVLHILSTIGVLIFLFISYSCAIPGLSTIKKVDSLFLEAEALDHSGSYNAAIDKYKAALKEFRKPGAYHSLRRHVDEDFPVLVNDRIIRCCSNFANSLFLEAEKSYHQGDYSESIKKYKATIKEPEKHGVPYSLLQDISTDFPTSTLVNFRIASCYSKLAEQSDDSEILYTNAITYVKKVAVSKTYSIYKAESYHLWGILLHKSGKHDKAVQRFRMFVEYFPENSLAAEASYHIGVFYHNQKNYPLSRKAFYQVLNTIPPSRFRDEAQYRIAQSFLDESNYEKAYQGFLKVHTSEFQVESRYYAAHCLYQLGRHSEALIQYINFTRAHPKSQYTVAVHITMGEIYSKKKDYKKALSSYQIALQNTEKRPLKIKLQLAIGKMYFGKKDYKNALSNYQLALQNTEKQPFKTEIQLAMAEAYLAIGKVHFGKKDYENALSSYQLALQNTEKYPLKTEIQLAIVLAYLNHGNAKNAMATCKRILSGTKIDRERMLKANSLTRERLTIAKGVQFYRYILHII